MQHNFYPAGFEQRVESGELLFLIFRVSPSKTLNTQGSKFLPSSNLPAAGHTAFLSGTFSVSSGGGDPSRPL